MGEMPSSLLVMFALNLCCGVTISHHCLFLPPVLVYPFNRILSLSICRCESGLQSNSAGKTTRKWNKQLIKLFSVQKSKFWLEFLELENPPGIMCSYLQLLGIHLCSWCVSLIISGLQQKINFSQFDAIPGAFVAFPHKVLIVINTLKFAAHKETNWFDKQHSSHQSKHRLDFYHAKSDVVSESE